MFRKPRMTLRTGPRTNRARSAESLEARLLMAADAWTAPLPAAADATGQISGHVWIDRNANQIDDQGEAFQPGITVYLDQNHNGQQDLGEPTSLTDGGGNYLFTGLAPGTYEIGEVPPPLWVQTSPATDFNTPNFVEKAQNAVGGVTGLNGAEAIVATDDGRHLYVASIINNTVTLFQRDPFSGRLTFSKTYQDGVGGFSGLLAAHWIAISTDQNFLYVAARGSNSVATFRRDLNTGELTPVQVVVEGQGVTGLQGASVIALSPDGKHAYVAGRFDNAVVVLRRDAATGMLTYVETEKNGILGVTGLDDVRWVEVSPDGRQVYACSLNDNALVTFNRNELTGRLTYASTLTDGVDGVDGLEQAASLSISHDGKQVYVAGSRDDAVAVFNRDLTTGTLTFLQVLKNGVDGVTGLDGAVALEISPDDRVVYVNGFLEDTLAVFDRDPSTGLLTPGIVRRNGLGGVSGLDGSHGVFFVRNGRSVYTAGYNEDTLDTWQLPNNSQIVVLGSGQVVEDVDFGIRNGTLVNRPPRLTLIGNRTVNEGELLSLVATATDPDPGDSLTFGLAAGHPTGMFILPVLGALQWLPKDSGGPFPVTVVVSDGNLDQPIDQETFQVTVKNVSPIANLGGPSSTATGAATSFGISATDPSQADTVAGFTYQFDWDGDGTIDETQLGPAGGVNIDHVFTVAGTYTVKAYATDKDGGQSAPSTLTITVEGVGLIGDANGDGEVGTADYTIWAATFGQTGSNLPADFDRNGEVGAADYTLWAANFGKTLGGAAAAAPRAADAAQAVVRQPALNTVLTGTTVPLSTSEKAAHLFGRRPLSATAVDAVLGHSGSADHPLAQPRSGPRQPAGLSLLGHLASRKGRG